MIRRGGHPNNFYGEETKPSVKSSHSKHKKKKPSVNILCLMFLFCVFLLLRLFYRYLVGRAVPDQSPVKTNNDLRIQVNPPKNQVIRLKDTTADVNSKSNLARVMSARQNVEQQGDASLQQLKERPKTPPEQIEISKKEHAAQKPPQERCGSNSTVYWRRVAIDLAELPVKQLLKRLDDDPFGVHTFEAALIQREVFLKRTLTLPELQELFPCPRCLLTSRLDTASLPAPKAFRQRESWLFFQHLRKAGGTHFCSLAQKNMPKEAVAEYYCMPDYSWSNWTCAGCLHHWSNEEMMKRMTRHKIAGNEWDNFAPRFLDMPVVFATSFRKPIDRALSQFRFECIEDRGCKILNVAKWWEKRSDLYNVYTTTFADAAQSYRKLKEIYLENSPEQAKKRGELIASALDVVLRFHLVLSMEFLAYAGPQVTAVLGFQDTSGLTHRVRPHLSQHERKDQQDRNALGAASITQASWDPKSYLSKVQYETMSETLALDMILTDAARRMFLERLVCNGKDAIEKASK